jgi:muramidase (phage lysozyme)
LSNKHLPSNPANADVASLGSHTSVIADHNGAFAANSQSTSASTKAMRPWAKSASPNGMASAAWPPPRIHTASFNSFAAHPWSKFPKSSWARGTSTASSAYRCTSETSEDFIRQRMLFDLEGHDLFTPIAQDRLAVMLMEEKGALPAVRKGDLDAAIKPMLNTWAGLPGASQNHGSKTADGKSMDMAYLHSICAKFLEIELWKFGIVE